MSFLATRNGLDATVYVNIQKSFGIDWSTVQYTDLVKPLYSGLAARLKIADYYRNSNIPTNVQDQATYLGAKLHDQCSGNSELLRDWKCQHNTELVADVRRMFLVNRPNDNMGNTLA